MISVSKTIQLQEIILEDVSELNELMASIYPPSYKHLWKQEDCSWYLNKCYGLTNLKKELEDKEARYFFVIHNSKKIGILRFIFNQHLKAYPNKSITYLHRIYLAQEAQSQGVAQKLFKWFEKQAMKKNNFHIWLEVMDTQEQALKFYKKQGFIQISSRQLDFIRIHEHLRGMNILQKDLL